MKNQNTEAQSSPLVFEVGQIAKMLGVSRKTVSELGKRGLLTPVRFSTDAKRTRRYSAESVFALIKSNRRRED